MKSVGLKTVLLVFVLVLSANSAWALDMEYYTYGGFDLMVQAFNLVALIFSDTDYKALLSSFAILGMLLGAAGWLVAKFADPNTKRFPLDWFIKVLAGVIIYIALFIPTGNVAIYDATLNKTQTIGGVPDGIVAVAGFLNKIERVIVNICDTAAGGEASFSGNAGGIGFELLSSLDNSQDIYARMSMSGYIDNCLKFEITRPGTTVGVDSLTGSTTDFMSVLSQAVNPSVFTVYYDSTNPAGTTMSCTAAWAKIQPLYAASGAYDKALARTCNNASLDTTNAAELQACKSIIENALNYSTGSSGLTTDTLLRQSQIARLLYESLSGDAQQSAALQSARSVTAKGFGTGISMSQWVPIIKALLNALAICIIPFLALLLPTPMVGKAISSMVGFFLFLTIWGTCDAIIHMAAMTYAANTFEKIGSNNLGMIAMANVPTLSAKTLAMFGYIRSAGLMLAAVFTQLLIKFGGSALAHLASGLMGAATMGGTVAGEMFTPEGISSEHQRLVNAAANMDVAAQENFSNRGAAQAYNEMQRIESLRNARIAAARAGLPEGMKSLARSVTGDVHLATNEGKMSAVVGPDGRVHMMDTTGMNAFGTKVTTGVGADGVGTRTDATKGGNTLDYAALGNGQYDLTGLKSKALDGYKSSRTIRDMQTTGVSRAFSNMSGFNSTLQTMIHSGTTDSTSRKQAEEFNHNVADSIKKQTTDNSGYGNGYSEDAVRQARQFYQAQMSAGVEFLGTGASGAAGIDASHGGAYKDSTGATHQVSAEAGRLINDTYTHATSEALINNQQTASGKEFNKTVLSSSGNSSVITQLNESKHMDMSQDSYGTDLSVPFVKHFAETHFDGSTTPEALDRAADYLSDKVNNGGVAGKQFVDNAFGEFVGSYHGGTAAGGHSSAHAGGIPGNAQELLHEAAVATDRVVAQPSAPLSPQTQSMRAEQAARNAETNRQYDANRQESDRRREEGRKTVEQHAERELPKSAPMDPMDNYGPPGVD